jgi:SAM-dependent methyltransferase
MHDYSAPRMDEREKVVAANLRFYEGRADSYRDGRADAAFRARYEPKFARGLGHAGRPRRALDCCAGTGLVTRLLLDRGCEVTAVELSPRMIEVIRTTVVGPSDPAELVCSEITEFLRATTSEWDLAVFGSAIHHLWNFDEVLDLALAHLAPGGAVYLIGEPVLQRTRAGRAVRSVELWTRRLSRRPGALVAGAARRLSFMASRRRHAEAVPASAVGFYAEVFAEGVPFDRVYRVLDRHDARIAWREVTTTGPKPIRALKRIVPGYEGDSLWLVATIPGR